MSLARMSLTGGCLIAAIAVFRALLFRLVPKRTLAWLWSAAALVLLLPVRLRWAGSVYGLLGASPEAISPGAVASPAALSAWTVIRPSVSVALAVCLTAAYILGLTRFYRGRIIRESWAERWLCDHPLRRGLTIRESEYISAPVSGGLLRPVILLPRGMEADRETLACVLAHELVHIKRLDGLYKLLLAAAVCLHWFNPLVWLMVCLACRDLEYACDETVLSGAADRAAYARALLAVETARSPLLISGFGGGTVGRMKEVTRFRRHGRLAWTVSLLASAVMVAVFATTPAASAPAERIEAENALLAQQFYRDEQAVRYVLVHGGFMTVQDGATIVCVPGKTPDDPGQQTVLLMGTEVDDGVYRLELEDNSVTVRFDYAAMTTEPTP